MVLHWIRLVVVLLAGSTLETWSLFSQQKWSGLKEYLWSLGVNSCMVRVHKQEKHLLLLKGQVLDYKIKDLP